MTPVEYLVLFSDSIIYLSALIIPLHLWGKDRKELFLYVLCLSSALTVVYFLKLLTAVPRPSFALVSLPPMPSFPSMHAALGLIPAGFFFYIKKYRVSLLVYGFLIAYSRVLLGVHYWVDIAVGAVLGFAIPFILFYKRDEIYSLFRERTK
jgi:membrane-associated phospholipid phosphatase